MQKLLALPLIALLAFLVPEHTFAETTNSIPAELRAAKFSCDQATIQAALELKRAAWTYIMPEPKSAQAAWGNTDKRTTWWVGYWVNGTDRSTSATQPKNDASGKLTGDGTGGRAWQRGGSPGFPSKIEWLCSTSGGVEPH
jgi:hypothetical protein